MLCSSGAGLKVLELVRAALRCLQELLMAMDQHLPMKAAARCAGDEQSLHDLDGR